MFRRVIVFWLLATSVAVADFPRQFHTAYGDDSAGNPHIRTTDFLVQTFAIDGRNQLSNVVRSGPFTVTGSIPASATNVTVNGAAAIIYNDLTFAALTNTLVNGTNSFTIIATGLNGAAVTNSLSLNLPVTNLFQYDANGNLINDGTRVFSYDAENQLTNAFQTNAWRVGFAYDGLQRRRITRDYSWNGSTWVETNEVRYIYDGKLVIQERDTNNNPQVTYTRGLDFSLTLRGAGGVGGLLARTDINGPTFYHTDASGNITSLIDAYQDIVARYRYDAYGKLLGRWGTLADANTYRFSSKEYDRNSGLYYYGYRFYDPNFQRWLNRDPLGLGAGPNAYTFAGNGPVMFFDPYGEYTAWEALQIAGAFFQGGGQGAQNVGNAAYNLVAGPSQLAGTLSTSYGQEQVADALGTAAFSVENFVEDPCARQQDLLNLANQASALLNNPDLLSQALANVGVMAATAGLGELAGGAEEASALTDAAEGGGSQALVQMAPELYANGEGRTVAGYYLYGNSGLVGSTYNVNVFQLSALEGQAQGLGALSDALQAEAQAAGASQISITGNAVVNGQLANPAIAARAASMNGFMYQQVNPGQFILTAPIKAP